MKDRPRPRDDLAAVVDWLVDGARSARRPQDVLAGLCDRLLACGLPLHRVAVFVTTLHPDVMGQRFLWREGEEVAISEAPYAIMETDTYQRSPVRIVFATGQPIRLPIGSPDCPQDYDIVPELRAEGVSDYLIQPLPFTSGEARAISWTTTRPGGFAEADLAALDAVSRPLARLVEIYALRRTATNLLDTYVGHHAGERILRGRIRRGDIERIEAVIMLTDLRDFTTLSEQLPGEQVIGLLSIYFDCVVPPIEAHGAEVLKLIGDGLLAIFAAAGDVGAACREALAVCEEVRAGLAAANAERERAGEPLLRHAMALHVGSVLYGNIGSAKRLDFTTIGPAVNLTARLESLARDLGRDLLVSAQFARHSPQKLVSLGSFELRGIAAPQEVFAAADDPAA
jgi:adenylate cyclase